MRIAKKYLLFSGLGRKKVGLTRVRIAKKIHSSLLIGCHDAFPVFKSSRLDQFYPWKSSVLM